LAAQAQASLISQPEMKTEAQLRFFAGRFKIKASL
jgi:hypothetical protein